VVGAVVFMDPNSAVDEKALTDFLSERLAAFKVPLKIWMSPSALPKLGSEKIDKVSLRNFYRGQYAVESAA
jgi:long-chain acyl-CoA synthetase